MPETPPHYSEDGRHWWDGGRWLPVAAFHPQGRPRAPLAIGVSLAVVLVTTLLTAGLVAASAPFQEGWRQAVKQAQQQVGSSSGFSNLQVCTAADFNQSTGTCRANAAGGGALQTNQFVCTATLAASGQAQQPSFNLSYAGHDLGSATPNGKQNQDGSFAVFAGYSLSSIHELPGGRWTCKFTFAGSSKSLSFRTSGPGGPLLYQSACISTGIDSSTALCGQDQSTLTSPSSISCTAVVVGAEQKQVKLDFVYQGGGPVQGFSRTANPQPDREFYAASITLQPQDVALSTTTMPPGKYTCLWSIDGRQVGEKDFQVG
jgi:hypothetical protein